MKPDAIFALFSFLASVIILSRYSSNFVETPGNRSVDVTTMATPKGERLKPAEDGPVRSTLGQPKVDLDSYQLAVSGLVNSPFSLTWEGIQEWPAAHTGKMIMYCIEGWEVWGDWKGILVKDLLQKASLKDNAQYVMFRCIDGYSTALPIAHLQKYDAMLAYEVNGKPLKDHDGFPLRLVAFGKYGYKWAKWVDELEVIDRPRKGTWETRGYSDRANVRVGRRRYYEGADAEPLDY